MKSKRSATNRSPSPYEHAALAVPTGENGCSCSLSVPTPTANLFGCRDVKRMLERRKRCKETSGNGNGFGLTLGQWAALNEIELTPELLEMLMGFPEGWTQVNE